MADLAFLPLIFLIPDIFAQEVLEAARQPLAAITPRFGSPAIYGAVNPVAKDCHAI
jgi:hypothetical protein